MSETKNHAAEGTRTVVMERVFPHAPEKLWRALTESPLVAQWLLKNDFEPVVGRRFQFRADPVPNWNGVIDCEVLAIEPLKRLSYSWGSMGLESVVLFTLTPADGGTQLRMEHSGFPVDQDAAYKGATHGWQSFLGKLEKVVAGVE
jgi:uncharacterized protein YndB with AHSA1/START domain